MTGATIKACRSVLLVGMLLAFAALAADSSSAISPIVVRKNEEMRNPTTEIAVSFGDVSHLSPWRLRRRFPRSAGTRGGQPTTLRDALDAINKVVAADDEMPEHTFEFAKDGSLVSVCDVQAAKLSVLFDGADKPVTADLLSAAVRDFDRVEFRMAGKAAARNAAGGTAGTASRKSGTTKTISLPGGETLEMIWCEPGSFMMGSPVAEEGRFDDEPLHPVTLTKGFWLGKYEVTQRQWQSVMGDNPSKFKNPDHPVEGVSWEDCNAFISRLNVVLGGVARFPTEAEWEYACRAGTETPFNTEKSMDADEANFYGHYPYEIEENYFDDSVLEARPGVYRQTTLPVGSFAPNGWGLYDMHGNVNEWCWDWYGAYDPEDAQDSSGPEDGTRHVYRGGGWNDFGKNMRSAYRAAGQSDLAAANLGIRLVRNAESGVPETVTAAETVHTPQSGGRVLIAYFSWGGNTRGIAKEIERQTGADLYEITPVHPYSDSYNTVLMEAQEDQHRNARPELSDPPESIEDYDVILLGYPNWWASIPMPVASFLELYDFSGKNVVPFCSHGGGRFGQSLTAIAKLAPDAVMGEGLSVHYSGGASLPDDVAAWLDLNGIERK